MWRFRRWYLESGKALSSMLGREQVLIQCEQPFILSVALVSSEATSTHTETHHQHHRAMRKSRVYKNTILTLGAFGLVFSNFFDHSPQSEKHLNKTMCGLVGGKWVQALNCTSPGRTCGNHKPSTPLLCIQRNSFAGVPRKWRRRFVAALFANTQSGAIPRLPALGRNMDHDALIGGKACSAEHEWIPPMGIVQPVLSGRSRSQKNCYEEVRDRLN